MKANIYIDGGNLYFGLLKGRPEVKWLDLDAFCRRLVGTDHELNAIKYFTANIKTYPHDPASIERQNLYLQAVAAKGGIETIFGYYNKNKTWLPAIDRRCVDCDVTGDGGRVHVMKFEEKRTDANIITEMLRDAFTSDIQSFILISGDSDFAAPLDLIRQELRRQVVVLNPKDRRSDLIHHATIYKDIPRDLPASCQLPDEVPVGRNGKTIRRPTAWK